MRARFEAEGDVIVVTGGGNGIGQALARAAAQAGARVVVCDVDEAAMTACPMFQGLRRGASTSPIARRCSRRSARSSAISAGSTASFARRRSNRGRSFTRCDRRSGIGSCGSIYRRRLVLPGGRRRHDRAQVRKHHRVHVRPRPPRLARSISLCREQGGVDRIRQKRGQGDGPASRALQPDRPRRDRYAAIPRSQCGRGRCALARLGRGRDQPRMWSGPLCSCCPSRRR